MTSQIICLSKKRQGAIRFQTINVTITDDPQNSPPAGDLDPRIRDDARDPGVSGGAGSDQLTIHDVWAVFGNEFAYVASTGADAFIFRPDAFNSHEVIDIAAFDRRNLDLDTFEPERSDVASTKNNLLEVCFGESEGDAGGKPERPQVLPGESPASRRREFQTSPSSRTATP